MVQIQCIILISPRVQFGAVQISTSKSGTYGALFPN